MNVSCPSCKTRYSVDDSRVPATGVTIRCPKCSHTFVAKRPDAGARPQSAVALPGSVANDRPAAPRGSSAVALPGSVAGNSRIPAATTDAGLDDDLDLGIEDTPPPSPSPAPGGYTDLPAPRASAAQAQSFDDGVLDFIDNTADRAGVDGARPTSIEYKVRRRNGRVDGPFGVPRLVAMIRNKELTGGEDISEDGVQWRAMTSHPELNQAINAIAAAEDGMAFGNVDLPIPAGTDLPASRDMPDLAARGHAAPSSAPPAFGGGAPIGGDLELDSPGGGNAFGGGGGGRAAAPRTPSSMDDLMDDLDLDDDLGDGDLDDLDDDPLGEDPPAPGERAARAPDDLEVGDIPELPPFWKTYKKPILAFVGAAALILVGVFTQLFTKCGAFGVLCAYEAITATAPPPAPPKPPPPPPKVADPKEIASLIDSGTYEGFRSVFATIQQAGPTLPDNMLALAKARGFATLAYGPAVFPLDDLTSSVEALNTVDLAKAMGGNSAAANVEILKARSALEILTAQAGSAANQLSGLAAQRSDDEEIALLLGVALSKTKKPVEALAALDKAIIAAPKYAPALHAIGDVVASMEEESSQIDAAVWYEKALIAKPEHARSAMAAADLYTAMHRFGERRRVRVKACEHAAVGLPPEQRAPVLLATVQDFDRLGRILEVTKFAAEGARLEPANSKHVGLAAIALSAEGKHDEGFALIDNLLKRNPADAEGLLARARLYNATEDIAKGFLDLDAARKSAPKDYRPPLWEARFHLQLGKFSDARLSLARAIKLAKTDPTPSVELGRLDLSEGDVDAAFLLAQDAVKVDPYDARSHVLLGACYGARGQLDKALETYQTARTLDDELVDAQLGYANTLRELGAKRKDPATSKELGEAIPTYLAVLEANPGNPQVLFEYGRGLEMTGDVQAALALYKEASSLDERDVRPHLKMVQAYLTQEEPDLAEATKSLKVAKKIEAQAGKPTAEVSFWDARVALTDRRVHDAESAMRQAVEMEPKNAEYAFWLGRVLEKNNSLYEAITFYEKSVSLNSRLAKAHRALGWTAIERHQFEKARLAFEKYREAAPDDPSIWADIGESYTRQNMDGKALTAFEKAVAANPKHADALMQIGQILSRRGKDKDAVSFFKRATRAAPKRADAWCQLGIATSQRGVTKESRRALQKCIELPNAPEDMRVTATNILESR